MKQLILPRLHCSKSIICDPLFFLAGPVRGGGDWQARACLYLTKFLTYFSVAVPCRYQPDHPVVKSLQLARSGSQFERQLDWERHYLWLAAKGGCLIFWLPAENKTEPRPAGTGPYARDSYGELGEWRGRLMFDQKLRIVVGAEADFPGLDVIKRNFQSAIGPEFPIYDSLEETVYQATQKIQIEA